MIDIIIISGKQGSGKTTTAQALRNKLKSEYSGVQNVKFATPLYALHEYILNRMEQWTGVKRVKKDGVLLQMLGTEYGRQVHGENVWVNILRNFMDNEMKQMFQFSRGLVIIDDCRFENEFDAFPDALRVRLDAPEQIRKPRTHAWREDTNHPSEIGLDQYADALKFDLYIGTGDENCTPEYAAGLIIAKLKERNQD